MSISPDHISSLINFYSTVMQPDWTFNPDGTDMRNLQVKGAARVFNLLKEHKIALLADEVGMGKTIQSLAVCAALWNENPKAKILVLTPRDEIAHNWEREYQTFIRHHYRHCDNIVKSVSTSEPAKQMIYCSNLYNLVHEVQQGWGQLYVGKISSFSSLMAGNKAVDRLRKLGIKNLTKAERLSRNPDKEFNEEIVSLLKKEVGNYTQGNKPYFDLIIIDEAHYFRRVNSDSLRVASARKFFGDPFSENFVPLSSKVLLLTATPNHSSSHDIKNIVSYFTNKYQNADYKKILDQICVRRLRRLSNKGLNKYNYRHEIPSPSDFKENPLSEMFFGLYQHELVKELHKNKADGSLGGGVSRMMKYLEGVEFIPFEKNKDNSNEDEDGEENKNLSTDYTNGSDSHILLGISKKFQENFGESPKHPKYDKLVQDLTVNHNQEKAVVFVRRIPSVFEISKRILEFHDRNLWDQLKSVNNSKLSYEKLDRKNFKKYVSNTTDPEEASDLSENTEEEGNIPTSRVLNLFKVIKNDSVKTTDASNFRLRFTHSKPSIFSLFFSPGADYGSKPYEEFRSFRFQVGNEELENYYNSALLSRTQSLSEIAVTKDIQSILLSKNPIPESEDLKNENIPTLLTEFFDVIQSDDLIDKEQKAKVISTYNSFTVYEKESFSNFLEKGTLLASEAVVWFYTIFKSIELKGEDEKPIPTYLQFVQRVKQELKTQLLYKQIQDSILHFRSVYTKVFNINNEKELLSESWDSFNNAQPIYPYNAANSNQKVLRCFNTPFYPNVLVATSVLQEGVNLQYFCNTIYHYGMAWTPGDNEQRIGRIDRMFGKIERLLEENESSKLHIYYPYLKDTVDEEHLGRFAKRKYKEESLIDRGKAFEETSDFAIEENEIGSWKQFLREPEKNQINDPFPADLHHFTSIKTLPYKKVNVDLSEFYDSIITALKDLQEFQNDFFVIDHSDNKRILIDPTLRNNRKQPVVIELVHDHIGSGFFGESVYCIKMRTPLAPYSKYKILRRRFYENGSLQSTYSPGIKLCIDPSQTTGTNWGIYMTAELPLFISSLNVNPLSIEEVQSAFQNLINCADETEKNIFGRDLSREELNLPINKLASSFSKSLRHSARQNINSHWSKRGDNLFLEKQFLNSNVIDLEKQSFIDNHNNLYVKTCLISGLWTYQVSYSNKDAYESELNLLEKHLNVFLNKQRMIGFTKID